eukprot:GHVU01227564.1.p2 GENE.GHVU01227564.1~~GHVU01227564.1.p2  ORF type:complete len:117 (+),score=10.83 GHVU01227564.1:152-502(+)
MNEGGGGRKKDNERPVLLGQSITDVPALVSTVAAAPSPLCASAHAHTRRDAFTPPMMHTHMYIHRQTDRQAHHTGQDMSKRFQIYISTEVTSWSGAPLPVGSDQRHLLPFHRRPVV